MNKKKILVVAMSLAMVAILAIGGTIAYFTAEDSQTNTFTIGDVTIDLFEDFNTNKEVLMPVVKEVTNDPWEGATVYHNAIEKEVYVKNTSTSEEPVYLRVNIAIPAIKENTNVLALLCDEYSTVNGKWIWGTTLDANYPTRDGGTWNFHKGIQINGVPYKYFTLTYESPVAYNEDTVDAIDKVYMDEATTQEEIANWNETYGENWKKIYVVAEAVQADGFSDAITALNTAFGVPGTYEIENWTAEGSGATFVEKDNVTGQ